MGAGMAIGLLLLFLLVVVGGGIGMYFLLKEPVPEEEEEEEANTVPDKAAADKAAAELLKVKTVKISKTSGILHLAEVQVFDQAGVNVAVGGTATQSSVYAGTAVAARGIDGNTNGAWGGNSVFHTDGGLETVNPFWTLTLPTATNVKEIKVWNRTDCCQDRLVGFKLEAMNSSGTVLKTFTLTADTTQTLTM
jgi:Na+-transporting methylmalonyl-CoA/oxaloacetate decarboxylase gamma subunit